MEHAEKHSPNYVAVWFGLAALTIIEVLIPTYMGFAKTTQIILLVGLALWKALLVALYYMHLRYEPRRLVLMVMVPLPLAVILVMAVLTEF